MLSHNRFLPFAATLLAATAVASLPAAAHSELRGTSPAPGAVLSAPPERIEFEFNERVMLTAVRLHRLSSGEMRLPDRRAIRESQRESVRLPPLEPGEYRIDWVAISADGHTIGGAIPFRVTPPA